MSKNSYSATRNGYRLIALTLVILMMVIGLVALEAVEHLLLPELDFWTSHLITITVSTAIAAVAADIVLRRLERLYDRLHEEMDDRIRAEQELARAHAQLELRVQERTAELEHANRELRQSEERYRTISEMVSDFCFSAHLGLDGETVIDWATEAFARITGYSLDEYNALGGMFALVVPEDDAPLHAYRARIISGETGEFEFRIRRKDGSICWLRSLAHPSINQGTGRVEGFFAALTDVTQRRQAEHALKEAMGLLEQHVADRTRELSMLLQISQNVASTLDLQPLLTLVLEQLKSLLDYDGAAIIVRDANGLNILHSNEWFSPEQLKRMLVQVSESDLHRELAKRRAPLIVAEPGNGSDADRVMAELFQDEKNGIVRPTGSWMVVPLVVKDRPIGMLLLTHDQPDYYNPHRAELAVAVANHAAIAIENAQLYESARRLAVVEERQRLARDLHDSVSQALYGIELGTQTAREMLGNAPGPLLEPIDYVQSLAKAALAEMRALIFDLRPEALATDGLVVGLRRQAASLQERHRLDVHLDLMPEPNVTLDVKETLYRIAQESLHNIVKHARARRVNVGLSRMDDTLVLDVLDDGVGFDPDRTYPGHLGLASMRERIARLGGTIAVESTPGAGSHIRAEIPLRL